MSTKRKSQSPKTTAATYDIVNGPNKDVLFDACKYAYSPYSKISPRFDVALAYTTKKGDPNGCFIPMDIHSFRIIRIEHEDGSGESFNIYGSCKATTREDDDITPHEFWAYYNAKKREGTITFVK